MKYVLSTILLLVLSASVLADPPPVHSGLVWDQTGDLINESKALFVQGGFCQKVLSGLDADDTFDDKKVVNACYVLNTACFNPPNSMPSASPCNINSQDSDPYANTAPTKSLCLYVIGQKNQNTKFDKTTFCQDYQNFLNQ